MLTPQPSAPLEGQNISLLLSVSDNAYLSTAALNWNDGTPHSQAWSSIHSTALNQTVSIGSYAEGAQIIYWGTAADASGNSSETAHTTLAVLDSDTDGPIITNIQVSEVGGNINGIIEAGEQVRLDWSANDPSGISSVTLNVNGSPVSVLDSYYSLCGPFAPGNYPYTISVADNDNSPASSAHNGFFTVESLPAPVVVAPNGGEVWTIGSPAVVSWNPGLVNYESTDIYLSRDNGGVWSPLVTGYVGTPFTWQLGIVTEPASNQCLVKVVGNYPGGSVEDVSDALFVIQSAAACVEVSAGTLEGVRNELLELPVNCEDVSNANITAFQFTLSFNPDSILAEPPYYILNGCLAEGWTIFEVHDNIAGSLTLGGFGVAPLSGSGILTKPVFRLAADALPGSCSQLQFDSFQFNEGTPCAATTGGQICAHMTNTVSGCLSYYNSDFAIPNIQLVVNDLE